MGPLTVDEVATHVAGQVEGDGGLRLKGVSSLDDAGGDELSFFSDPAFVAAYRSSRAGAILVGLETPAHTRATLIRVADPVLALDSLVELLLDGPRLPEAGIHETAVISEEAWVDPSAHVGPYCVIESGVRVGARSRLMSHVVLEPGVTVGEDSTLWSFTCVREGCRLGDRVLVHPGVVIGFDGFGFENREGRWIKNPQRGTVVIGDDVEIGANATIARARFGKTVIGEGTKIDADVQVGHNVQIGRHVYVGAMCGFGGTSVVEDHCVVAPQSGTVPHVRVTSGSILAGRTGVTKDITEAGTYWGFPAQPIREYQRQLSALRQIRSLKDTIQDLTRRLDALETATNDRPAG